MQIVLVQLCVLLLETAGHQHSMGASRRLQCLHLTLQHLSVTSGQQRLPHIQLMKEVSLARVGTIHAFAEIAADT